MSAEAAHRVQILVDDLKKTRPGDLGNNSTVQGKLQELEGALAEVRTFRESAEKLLGSYLPARRGPGPACRLLSA